MSKIENSVKAWEIELYDGAGTLWLDDPELVARECIIGGNERNGRYWTTDQVAQMQPGELLESDEWTITCHRVNRERLDNLPEHPGW